MRNSIVGIPSEQGRRDPLILSAEKAREARKLFDNGCEPGRVAAAKRVLEIYREGGSVEMDFSLPRPKTPRFKAVRRFLAIKRSAIVRIWVWNVSYPLKMWFHFRFQREKTLPYGQAAIRAMLSEAFAKNGVTNLDMPYAISDAPDDAKSEPYHYDLIFNGKRVKGA